MTILTLPRFSRPETPLVRRPTIWSFQAIVLRQIELRRARGYSERAFPERKLRRRMNSSAAWISALEGMQPTLRQTPPSFFASTITVSMPSCPARIAQT